jgi:hypothetical protein
MSTDRNLYRQPKRKEPRAPETCPLCGQPSVREALSYNEMLETRVCMVCDQAAQRIRAAYYGAETRQRDELKRQLPQLVRDLRAGAEVPEFFRGI